MKRYTRGERGRSPECFARSFSAGAGSRRDIHAERLRRPRSPLIGSVAYFPERYGDEILRLASALLAKQEIPPAVFTRHELITRENVDRIYPLDKVLPETLSPSLVP